VLEDGFLLIAGPEQDPKKKKHAIAAGDYAVYSWYGDDVRKLLDLPSYGKSAKPEALLPLDGNGANMRVLLMFDGPKEGAPTPVDMIF